jgi:alpha-methylacyl-CoA racemase
MPKLHALKGVSILSLSLNLPGPAALMRCQQLGARCVKLEPATGDPMRLYSPNAYAQLHTGVRIVKADLKTELGQRVLHRHLIKTDILLTSFRPSALQKLGLTWKLLHRQYPQLSMVAIVGAPGVRAELPGHDLTYMAENDLIPALELPASLFADMAGSLLAVEAVLQAVLTQRSKVAGVHMQVALSEAAAYMGLPRTWGLTQTGAAVGGGHAGYRIYACKNGRVAVAALEPHFASSLCALAGIRVDSMKTLYAPQTRQTLEIWMATKTRQQLEDLALKHDIPLHTLPKLPKIAKTAEVLAYS